MFCKNCGAQISDDAKFCGVCGTAQSETAAPVIPANPNSASASAGAAITPGAINLKDIVKYIATGVAVLALIFAIMNIFNTYEIKLSAGSWGSTKMDVADLFEKELDGKFTLILIANILFGLANLAVAAISVLYFLKENKKMDLYDKYIAKYTKGQSALFSVGVLGAAAALVQIILYAVCKANVYGIKYTVAVHWTTWFALILYAGCAVLDKFVLNKKQ